MRCDGLFLILYSLLVICLLLTPHSSITCAADPSHKACGDVEEERMFLWKIRAKTPSFLFGTIHVPYTRVWDSISIKIKRAFYASDLVMVELNLSDPLTLAALNQCQLLPESRKLRQVIPRQLFSRIKRHLLYVRTQMSAWLPKSGMSVQVKKVFSEQLFSAITKDWERKRPIWVMLMINSLTEHDIKSRGIPVLDTYLTQEAERMKKETGAVERVYEQCQPLNGLNHNKVLYILDRTMMQHEAIRRGLLTSPLTTDDSIQQYICGHFQSQLFDSPTSTSSPAATTSNPLSGSVSNVTQSSLTSLVTIPTYISGHNDSISDEIDSYFRSEMILKRNQNMGRRIVKLLKERPNTKFFFAFGAAHFLGNNSVINFIEQEGGFQVLRVTESKSKKKRRKKKKQQQQARGSEPE